ncbi:MAG: TonB-dependent receptor [Flavobacteriales bacterium]|nr:TonB-dependent receptor [Flavobacteriales bacterium]
MLRTTLTWSSILTAVLLNAQAIRGDVKDAESLISLPGATVLVVGSDPVIGTVTDAEGRFSLAGLPPGRTALQVRMIGYEEQLLSGLVLTSAKDLVINVRLQSALTELGEVEVVGDAEPGGVRNEMALLSARQFSVEETDRYAGSRGDPGRMASNFAGVQGADDSRNDIVIRGNSPMGVLWRFEGVNIPNPNHFAIPGTGGGPVTILNNKYLANSDFFTGAFPAEFGNATAGVFDLRMRNGNADKHEFTAQLGFLGTELMAEGPLSKKHRSSYLVSYRYSTLRLFGFLGIRIGTDAIPQYQDAAFRLHFPSKKGSVSFWGIGGSSRIDITISDQEKPDTATLIYGENDRDQYFRSRMGTMGATATRTLNENTYVKATLALSGQGINSDHRYVYRRVVDGRFVVDSLPPLLRYRFEESKAMLYVFANRKLGLRTSLRVGVNSEQQWASYLDSARTITPSTVSGQPNTLSAWRVRWDARVSVTQLQPYAQLRHRFNEQWTATVGATSLYNSINDNSFSPIEPRFGISYAPDTRQRISAGYGLHSQMQPGYLLFYGATTNGRDPQEQNTGIGPTRAHHWVLGYDLRAGRSLRVKVEAYYQWLFNIPVSVRPSSFSLVNTGAGFTRFFPDSLRNRGNGYNQGVELTVEHAFTKGWYGLFTASLFDAKYRGSDGVWRNTSFNGRNAFNLVLAREFTTKKKSMVSIGAKLTYAGGRWYGPVDRDASAAAQEVVYVDSLVNTKQFRPYFRADLKLGYRHNRPKVMHEVGLDLVNVTGQRNILTLSYAPNHPSGDPIREEYQLGFLPLFFYKVEF